MTLLFAGNYPTEFNNTGNTASANTSNDAYGDPAYNLQQGTTGNQGSGHAIGTATLPFALGGISEVWAGFTMGNILGSASEGSTATMMQISNSSAQGIVRLQNTSGPTRTFQYWNGSAWTSIGTLSNTTTRNGCRIDIHCKIHGSAGDFSIYVNGVLQQSLTGNTDFFSATIDAVTWSNWGQFNGRTITECRVATTDTRKIRVVSGYFTGDSATNTGWTGGFANLNETIPANYTSADADASVSSAGGQAMSFTKPALGSKGDDGTILGVAISVRAKNDGSSADFDLLCRSNSTNYTVSHGRTINTTNTNGYYGLWTTDPNGGIPWTKAAVDAAELGFQSKNAGVSTIYLASYVVAIQDDFLEPWDTGYPTTVENAAMVEVTAPASVGYVDVTVPGMISDGCSPKLAMLFTTGHAHGAAVAGASQQWGWVYNEYRTNFAAKGSVGYISSDAAAASSTVRRTQSRTMTDFAQANGGWLIDASGLRVRFAKFIKGGVRLYYETTTSGRHFSVMLFWGANLSIQYWTQNLGTVTTAQAVTGIGFKPDAGIFFSAGSTIGDTANGYYSVGMAADDGGGLQQRAFMRFSPTAVAAGPQPVSLIDDTVIGGLLNATPAVAWDLTLNSFDTDGFTVQASASAVSATLYSILFKRTDGKKFKIVDYTTPTASGLHGVSGLGFTPEVAFGVTTSLQSINSIVQDTEEASSAGFFAIAPDTTLVSMNYAEVTTSDPSDCNSYMDVVNPIRIGTNSGTVAEVVASLDAWNDDGITFNYTSVSGTAKKGFMLFFEGQPTDSNSLDSNSNSNDVANVEFAADLIFVSM